MIEPTFGSPATVALFSRLRYYLATHPDQDVLAFLFNRLNGVRVKLKLLDDVAEFKSDVAYINDLFFSDTRDVFSATWHSTGSITWPSAGRPMAQIVIVRDKHTATIVRGLNEFDLLVFDPTEGKTADQLVEMARRHRNGGTHAHTLARRLNEAKSGAHVVTSSEDDAAYFRYGPGRYYAANPSEKIKGHSGAGLMVTIKLIDKDGDARGTLTCNINDIVFVEPLPLPAQTPFDDLHGAELFKYAQVPHQLSEEDHNTLIRRLTAELKGWDTATPSGWCEIVSFDVVGLSWPNNTIAHVRRHNQATGTSTDYLYGINELYLRSWSHSTRLPQAQLTDFEIEQVKLLTDFEIEQVKLSIMSDAQLLAYAKEERAPTAGQRRALRDALRRFVDRAVVVTASTALSRHIPATAPEPPEPGPLYSVIAVYDGGSGPNGILLHLRGPHNYPVEHEIYLPIDAIELPGSTAPAQPKSNLPASVMMAEEDSKCIAALKKASFRKFDARYSSFAAMTDHELFEFAKTDEANICIGYIASRLVGKRCAPAYLDSFNGRSHFKGHTSAPIISVSCGSFGPPVVTFSSQTGGGAVQTLFYMLKLVEDE